MVWFIRSADTLCNPAGKSRLKAYPVGSGVSPFANAPASEPGPAEAFHPHPRSTSMCIRTPLSLPPFLLPSLSRTHQQMNELMRDDADSAVHTRRVEHARTNDQQCQGGAACRRVQPAAPQVRKAQEGYWWQGQPQVYSFSEGYW